MVESINSGAARAGKSVGAFIRDSLSQSLGLPSSDFGPARVEAQAQAAAQAAQAQVSKRPTDPELPAQPAAPATTATAINYILPKFRNQLCVVTLSSWVKQNLALIGSRAIEITHGTTVLFLFGLRGFPS